MELSQPLLDWLLDESEPGPRYLALRDVLRLKADDPLLVKARTEAHLHGPIAKVLDKMAPEGWWVQPGGGKGAGGGGYSPKYRSMVWALILLSQLGASVEADPRLRTACSYYLEHALADGEKISYNGAPSGTIACLQGNMLAALLELGYDDPRLDQAFDWMARTVTGEGMSSAKEKKAPRRYFAYNCGPRFACGANLGEPCAWAAVKEMLAFARLPVNRRTPAIQRAIQAGIDFLFSVDPAEAAYPSPGTGKPSSDWWKFGFPVFYITDLIQLVEALVLLGCREDPRLANALELIRSKQDEQGRWKMQFNYSGKTWGDYGRKGAPNKWVTLRALKVLV